MTKELNISSTYYPEDRPSINRWFRWIFGKDMNLEAVNTNTLLGSAFVDGYKKDPDKACKELLQAYGDNPEMVEQVIGIENVQKLLK